MECRPVYKGIRHMNDAALKSFIQKERTTQRNSQKLNENDLPRLIAQEEDLKRSNAGSVASVEVTQADIDQMVEEGLITYEDGTLIINKKE